MIGILDDGIYPTHPIYNPNRMDRRKKFRKRVRNKSIDTCHPKDRISILNRMNFMKERSILKGMSNSYKKDLDNIGVDKGLGFLRKWFK